jgi:spectinomycin phosphotransferase
MRARPEGVELGAVTDALRDGWDFKVDDADYLPVGAGSYHWQVADTSGTPAFVTVDDLGWKTWLGDTHDESFDGLANAFDAAAALREAGLRFVVAPIRTREGESLRRLDERYAIALFPFIDGGSGDFGPYGNDEDRLGVVALLAELHGATAAAGTNLQTRGFDLPGRRHIETALLERDEPWTGGPLSEPAREAVRASASELAELLALADRLAADAETRRPGWVVTHGEPHPGNVMRTSAGDQLLVDWDTVALGPPERDLWMLVDEGADASELYTQLTGTELDDVALDFFRLTWELKDLAEYLNVFRSPHEENGDTLRQLGALARIPALRDAWPPKKG